MTSSQPKRRDWDYTRSYTLWQGDVKPQPQELPYVIAFKPLDENSQPGVPHPYVIWCEDNCTEPWAWWFDAFTSYMGFASQSDFMIFKLIFA
jgi:hypothetical protein